MRRLTVGVAVLAILAIASGADADNYPSRPVTIVVPFTPGAGTDILARMIGARLEARLKGKFIIENKPGAGTVIGTNDVAKSEPDGYTLLMATSTPMAINATLHKALPYDPVKDLVPLAMVANSPFVLIVNPSLPVHSVAELIALAKSKPGKLTFGSGGPGSPHHLFAELFASMTGTRLSHVPYKGSVPALNDVVAGHIDFMFCDFASAVGMLRSDRVRPLAVSTKARIPDYPDLPPLDEAGVPGFDIAAWFMVAAPAQTPAPIVATLHAALKETLATAESKAQIAKLSMVPLDSPSVPAMKDFVKSEIVRWGKVVKQAGVAGSQ